MTTPHDVPYRAKALQLAVATPPALIWLMLGVISLVWWAALIVSWFVSEVGGAPGLMAYLMIVCTVAIGLAGLEARLFYRAAKGRSTLWPHVAMFFAGVVVIAMLGVVGD